MNRGVHLFSFVQDMGRWQGEDFNFVFHITDNGPTYYPLLLWCIQGEKKPQESSFYGSEIEIKKNKSASIVQFPLFSYLALKAGCRCTWKEDSYCGSIHLLNQLSSWVFLNLLWPQLVTV